MHLCTCHKHHPNVSCGAWWFEQRNKKVVGEPSQRCSEPESARLTAATTEQILCIVSTLPHFSLCTDTVYTTHASSPTVLTSHLPVLYRSTVHTSPPHSLYSLVLHSDFGEFGISKQHKISSHPT